MVDLLRPYQDSPTTTIQVSNYPFHDLDFTLLDLGHAAHEADLLFGCAKRQIFILVDKGDAAVAII